MYVKEFGSPISVFVVKPLEVTVKYSTLGTCGTKCPITVPLALTSPEAVILLTVRSLLALIGLLIVILSSPSILNGVLVCVVNDIVPVAPDEPTVTSALPCNTVAPAIL